MNTPARSHPIPESGNVNEVFSRDDWGPGSYCGPMMGYTGTKPAVFFLLPNAREEGATPHQRAIHHVCSPPHDFRECADGSLEIRPSIGAMPSWHGYLDEGNVWREC